MTFSAFTKYLACLAAVVTIVTGLGSMTGTTYISTASAQQAGKVPGNALGASSDTDFWRAVRQGEQGNVSIPDARAGVLVQSEGENWRAFRNGPLSVFGAWALLGMVILLCVFFILRGRIKVEHGLSGKLIERFNTVERFAHWLTATSFVVLALTGLNVLYGRYALLPLIGADAFSVITVAGKYMHNYLAFPFMVGVVMMFVLWVGHNIPSRTDLNWIAKAGGLFTKGVHPPAKKFNAGQKLIFWSVIIGGASISVSGVALLFPFEIQMFGKTFAFINIFGASLPTQLTVMQEMQLSQLWHAVVGIGLIVVIIAHIYIGSIGMEGAFDAMGSGQVDENWAKEHHSLWVEEVKAHQASSGSD
ncbi:formate dehydrogenase subunit gamma [Nisaea sp.]|uniref:formate dehydrogenase subunit gamma n=1 Tax=Nisaea sp. TaxID=2024842 RepID=UPI003267108D